MPTNESTIILEGKEEKSQTISLSTLAKDVATVGSGTLLAAIFNTLLVFVIPRLLSVEDFGYWRLFLLYAGYVGFLHLGLADGALLRWAGKPLEEIHPEVGPCLRFLFWQHLGFIVPAGLVVGWLLPPPLGMIGVAVLVLALVVNSAALLQYSFQGARQFRPVAVATATPVGGFLALTFLLSLRRTPNFRELMLFYCLAWTAALIFLWARLRREPCSSSRGSAWSAGKACVLLGWPIVLANSGFGLVQSADRLAVSAVLPIYGFAQYSLAVSTMFVPVSAIVVVYRVFFSHVAAVEHEDRAQVYAHASKFLLLAWSLLLPYCFVLEAFVRRFIPKYVPALPLARILLLGVIFLAGIQILHMSFAYLYGRQRQFLYLTVGAVVMSLSIAGVMAWVVGSLAAVAVGQVVALALWWSVNEWVLRDASGQNWKDWLRALSVFAWSAASYVLVLWFAPHPTGRILLYYLLTSSVLWLMFKYELRLSFRMLFMRTVNWRIEQS